MTSTLFTTFVFQPGLLVTDVSAEMEAGVLTTTEPALPDTETALDVFVMAEAAQRHASHVSLFASHGSARPQPLFSPPLRRAAAQKTMSASPHDVLGLLEGLNHWDDQRRLDAARQLKKIHRRSEEKRPALERALLNRIGFETKPEVTNRMIRIYRAMRRFSQTGRDNGYHPRNRKVVSLQKLLAAARRVLNQIPPAERPKLTRREVTRQIVRDYNDHLPAGTSPFSPSTFIRHVSGDQARREFVSLLDRKGIKKIPHTFINPEGARSAVVRAILQIKTERTKEERGPMIHQESVIRRAYAIYCDSLPKSQQPTYHGFRNFFLGRSHPSLLPELFRQHGVVNYSKVLGKNPAAGRAALVQASKELGPKAEPFPLARRAHQIYLEQNPGGPLPTIQAFLKFVERMRR